MSKGSLNVSLKGADDIFSTEESRQEQQREQVQQIPIGELFPFKNHPFKVLDDESMQRTVESVEQYGVLSPLIARPRPEGGYEIISGHRRQHAAQLAGLDTLPVIVRNMDDDAAVLLMVDSNLQRESILPSERAFAYKMKLEAMKHQAGRPTQDNYSQVGNNFGALSSEEMAEELGTSKNQIFRYIRLTNLIPELLDIQNLRKDREVTQEQLAIDLNISDRYMRNLEKGEKVPSVDLFVELRERFGSSLDYIVLGVSASQREQELQDQLQMLRKELKEMQRRILVMLEMLGESA
jgi:ParB family chromosome partitioning protein